MKRLTTPIILLIAALLWSNSIFSQGIAIGEGDSSPHASAILDLQSTQHGLLIPRMTTAQRGEIKSPAEGLLIYNTTTDKLDIYTGAEGWYSLEAISDGAATGSTAPGGGMSVNETGADPHDVAILDVSSTEKGFLLPRTEPTTVSGPTESLIIFNTISKRLTIYNGSDWAELLHNAESTATTAGTGSQTGMLISNTDDTQPHHSAILELRSTNGKGLLVPRMTTAQRNALAPIQGLIIYNTETQNITYCTGTEWWRVMDCYFPASPTASTHTTGSEQIIWNWNTATGADGYKYNTANDYATATDNGASTSFTQSGLDICTSYTIYVWAYNDCGNSTVLTLAETTTGSVPTTPTAGTHTPSETQIIWNWNTATGADGYKYNTANDYATATDNGTSTSFTQSGLDICTSYAIYVWAYNDCGNSTVLTLAETTTGACPCDGVIAPSGYGIVESSGKCWLDRNIGASQVATSSTDAAAYGDLYQWGRAADGHQLRTTGVTSGTCDAVSTNTPPHSNFIKCNSSPYDWRVPQNANLWQGVSGTNNPCPSGWRVPTEEEWNTERLSWAPNNNSIGAINSPLKLPVAGFRLGAIGLFSGVGSTGYYWSSTVDGIYSRYLAFSSLGAGVSSCRRVDGCSVRCIKD